MLKLLLQTRLSMVSDDKTTFAELKVKIKKFEDDRDWKQFNTPKNLSMAIAAEAGELLDHFLWRNDSEIEKDILADKKKIEEIKKEVADVLILALSMSEKLGIDASKAIEEKLEHNAKKYPVEKFKGSYKKYNE